MSESLPDRYAMYYVRPASDGWYEVIVCYKTPELPTEEKKYRFFPSEFEARIFGEAWRDEIATKIGAL